MNLKEARKCKTCNGNGEYATMDKVYNDDPAIVAPVGTEVCSNCGGSGLEPDDDIVLECVLENLSDEDEEKLQIYFMKNNGELGINKDNCESLFDGWLSNLTIDEVESILYGRN